MATKRKSVKVTKRSSTGKNVEFEDKKTGRKMSDQEFVKYIENEQYLGYHIRVIKGVKTPVSNPDGKEGNNLG